MLLPPKKKIRRGLRSVVGFSPLETTAVSAKHRVFPISRPTGWLEGFRQLIRLIAWKAPSHVERDTNVTLGWLEGWEDGRGEGGERQQCTVGFSYFKLHVLPGEYIFTMSLAGSSKTVFICCILDWIREVHGRCHYRNDTFMAQPFTALVGWMI